MSELYDIFREHPHISTDTRNIGADSIFFALRGATFDGNHFAAEALDKGAAYAVVDDPAAVTDERMVLVGDTLGALQELAREHRRRLAIPILAISGSNGKTTTKELVSRVLAERFEVYATRGNLNNHIGVPLTLLAMTRDTQFGVVEMGASACGEIALLASIAEPNYGILTNIGRAHLEGFGGPEGVRRGKGELFDYLAANGGRAFVPREDETLTNMAAERDGLAVEYYSVTLAEGLENHLEGHYNRFNIAAAVAVGRYFDVADERIRHAVGSYVPDNNRSQRTETGRNTLIVDCYNANPDSMKAALAMFKEYPCKRRFALLGDMLELGDISRAAHEEVGRQAVENKVDYLVTYGEQAKRIAVVAAAKGVETLHADSYREAADALLSRVQPGDAILVKASHGMALEKVLEKIVSGNCFNEWPVLSVIFHGSLYSWSLFFLMVLCLYRRKYWCFQMSLLPFLYFGTMLLGPVVQVRYLFPIMVMLPVLAAFFSSDRMKSQSNENREQKVVFLGRKIYNKAIG